MHDRRAMCGSSRVVRSTTVLATRIPGPQGHTPCSRVADSLVGVLKADLSVLEDAVEQAGILKRHEGKVCMRVQPGYSTRARFFPGPRFSALLLSPYVAVLHGSSVRPSLPAGCSLSLPC